jgi:hypothetical protein
MKLLMKNAIEPAPFFDAETLAQARKPVTAKDRIKAVLVALGCLAVGSAMWIWHQFYVSDLISMAIRGEAVHRFRIKIDWLWCRPTGTLLILGGLLVLLGALTKRSASKTERA